jgi:hypothetical protein
MHVEVTQKDIERGRPGACWGCPIALAISRACGCDASVTHPSVLLKPTSGYYLRSRLPDEARDWLLRFDRREAVEPISFDLPETVALI